MGSEGVAVAAINYQAGSGEPYAIHGLFQEAPGEAWTVPHKVSRPAATGLKQRSALVFNPQGEASIWWAEKDAVGWMLRFADLHTRGPLPADLVVPGQVGTGIEATYSVSPSDIGAVVDVHWEWDDGSDPTTGANVKHIFGHAGTYRVKLLMTDAVAKQTLVSCNVVVGPGTPGSCDAPVTPPDPGPGPRAAGRSGARRRSPGLMPGPGPAPAPAQAARSPRPGAPGRPGSGQAAQAARVLRQQRRRVHDDRASSSRPVRGRWSSSSPR